MVLGQRQVNGGSENCLPSAKVIVRVHRVRSKRLPWRTATTGFEEYRLSTQRISFVLHNRNIWSSNMPSMDVKHSPRRRVSMRLIGDCCVYREVRSLCIMRTADVSPSSPVISDWMMTSKDTVPLRYLEPFCKSCLSRPRNIPVA